MPPVLPAFFDNPQLFGRDPTPGLLAFEPRDHLVQIYRRADSAVTVEPIAFRPFLLLTDPDLLAAYKGEATLEPLDGDHGYRWLALLPSWAEALRAREHCRLVSGRLPGAPEAPYRFFNDPGHQFLLVTGKTSFRGMAFADLRRLALDIEVTTAPGFEFPNAEREADRIIAISMADASGWTVVLSGAERSEAELLAECSRVIRERDPDVIEGHNIFRFDLEYLERRAARHGVALDWGRDASTLVGHPARMQVAERTIAYRRYHIAGRHIVDTWMLAQLYDVGARDLDSYGLKEVARHFGVAATDRTYLPPEDIPRIFREDPQRLMAYARDDAIEALALSGILSQPYFVQAQALPFDYGSVILRGNATKIDALLLREYLHARRAVPLPGPGQAVSGGYTAMLHRGIGRGVLHVDITSLYPSIMLADDLRPASDSLGVFSSMLRDLRAFRVAAKRLAQDAADDGDRRLLGALQQTFKILINSFYGYLGFSLGHWNDFEAANRVTAEGRRLITALVQRLGELGAVVIEVDTDGLYFVPPAGGAAGGAEEDALLHNLASVLPPGIHLELAGRYAAMLSYKIKNYVLLDTAGRLRVRGSGLRSRGIELFQRRWMEELFALLLAGRSQEVEAMTRRWEEDFLAHRVPLKQIMKTDTLQDSLPGYRDKVAAGKRNAAAPYELALRSGRPYQPGDQVSYYVTGNRPRVKVLEAARLASSWNPAAPDENTAYYIGKLRELQERFRPLIEAEGLVPVNEVGAVEAVVQSDLGLDQ